MGLLTPKGKKNDKKGSAAPKHTAPGSKFMPNKQTKSSGGFAKKPMTGGSQRGS
ncbi:MAG: hypothetical protein ACXVMS_07040 [Flavisolibacter sp.]